MEQEYWTGPGQCNTSVRTMIELNKIGVTITDTYKNNKIALFWDQIKKHILIA